MAGWFSRLRWRLPRRRRRLWRYVSGRRRRTGIFAFALLVIMAAGYWGMTNDARVQRQAEQYIQRLTGARVKTDGAKFHLFGEIRISNLKVQLPGDHDVLFFEKSEVFLSHRPWSLLRGRLEPTKIVCVGAIVRPVLDLDTGRWSFPIIRPSGLPGEKMPLIPIYLRDAELEIIEVLDGQQIRRPRVPLSASLVPDAEGKVYNIILEDDAGTIQGRGTIDVATGRTIITAPVWEKWLNRTLPRQWLKWKERHKLTFRKPWNVTVSLGGSATATGPARRNQLTVELKDVSMELPPKEGGLKFTGVNGALVFDADGVEIKTLTGRIVDAGGAEFTLTGRYEGYEADSPFNTSLTVIGASVPLGEDLTALWGQAFTDFHRQIAPVGLLDISAKLNRDRRGQLRIDGRAELKGVSLRLPYWPIRVSDLRGRIALAGDDLRLTDLQGRYGQARVNISGRVGRIGDRPDYDINITVHDLSLTDEVRDTLPDGPRRIWDELSPRGQADFTVGVLGGGESGSPAVKVTINLDGRTSFEYAGFPYRLERVSGQVTVSAEDVRIVSLRGQSPSRLGGSAGPARCLLNGYIARGKGRDEFRISIEEVTDLPLDDRLARAIPAPARSAYAACGLTGRADITKATVWRENGGPVKLDIPVALKGVGVKHRRFPYRIENAGGAVKITHRQVEIQRLVGRHGRANINVRGVVPVEEGRRDGVLTVVATNLALDSALRDALPADARRGWDLLAPTGTANVTMTLRNVGAAAAGQTLPVTAPARLGASAPSSRPAGDYRLVVQPRDMRITYRHFPYPMRILTGRAVIEPGLITLESLSGLAGGAKVVLGGTVRTGRDDERAELNIETGMITLDRQLISALPAGVVRALQLRSGGQIALTLKKLQVWRPSGRAASRPAGQVAWRWVGKIALKDATVDLGIAGKRLTGRIEGEMACDGPPEKLTAEANVVLDTLVVGPRELKEITARLHKAADSPILRIDKISGHVFGGRVAGFAEVRLARPAKYGMSLSVEDIDLAEFLKTEAKAHEPGSDVLGRLAGNIQLTATVGDNASRRANGKLHISRAKLYKLPVLLGFLHVINLTLPSKSAFHTGEVDYYLRGDTLVFREMHLQGSALSMLGAGTMDIKKEKLNLTFLTGPPRKLPRLAALGDVLAGIASQLMTVRVTGTLAKPRIKTTAFRSLDATLRELYQPGQE